MEDIVSPIPTTKVYNDRSVGLGTFLGGPLIGGYLLAENFKALGQPQKAKFTYIGTAIAMVLLFGLVFFTYGSPIVRFFAFADGILGAFLTRILQGDLISEHASSGGQYYSGWRAAGIGLIGSLIMMLPIIVAVLLSGAGPF